MITPDFIMNNDKNSLGYTLLVNVNYTNIYHFCLKRSI